MNYSHLLEVNKSLGDLVNPIKQNLLLRFRTISNIQSSAFDIFHIDVEAHERVKGKAVASNKIGMIETSQGIDFVD